jgi:hypothetical protein
MFCFLCKSEIRPATLSHTPPARFATTSSSVAVETKRPLTEKLLFHYTGWCRETVKFEIIRKKTKETYKTLFDPENVFYKSGNFIRHHFLKIKSVKCCPFRS